MNQFEKIIKDYSYINFINDDKWVEDGLDLLSDKEYKKAAKKFKELIASQPFHHTGYIGLSFVYYEINEKEKAVLFMKKALELARNFLKDNSISMIFIEEIEVYLQCMINNETIYPWERLC